MSRLYPLRTICKKEVATSPELCSMFETHTKAPGRCTYRQGRFIDHKRARLQTCPNSSCSSIDRVKVYLVLCVYDNRYDDNYNPSLAYSFRHIDCCRE